MSEDQDLLQRIAAASARVDPALSDRDVERLVEGARRRLRRRALRRIGLLTLAVATGVVALALAVVVHRPPIPAKPVAIASGLPKASPLPAADQAVDMRVLRLGDGSLASPLDNDSQIIIAHESANHVGLTLVRGRGRFEVTSRAPRTFSVAAGEVTVTVVGTIFTVERVADRVGVAVERGIVRVDWGVGGKLLQKGESGWFPPLVVGTPLDQRAARAPQARRIKVAPSESEPPRQAAPKPESAEELLLAADSARLAGRPDQGADLLKRLLRDHRVDPRAPLAAFTLGRVLLMELGQPREAAAAFAEVRQLSPNGSFAEDALAREVEAWSQAGQKQLARARAQEYLRLYPGGRRVPMVRSMGGME